ncbi:MAG: hypothetical protein ABSE40_18540 [Candidatus Sulfotelmatobacter sp.]|jgi:hypothetical protein
MTVGFAKKLSYEMGKVAARIIAAARHPVQGRLKGWDDNDEDQ